MLLNNQCRPYEANPGDTGRVVEHYCNYFAKWFASARFVRYHKIRAMYPEILEAFDKIPKKSETRARVGIVGEIYVKYSPLGNNHLEDSSFPKARSRWCRGFSISAFTACTTAL